MKSSLSAACCTTANRIIVADSQRNRLQVYRKVRDYADFQANL